MFSQPMQSIIVFTLAIVILFIFFCVFIITIIYRYQLKQNSYFKEIEELKISHENAILMTQLEMQEYTFQNISREIHDNIGQKLSLVKLYLNSITYSNNAPEIQVSQSISILSTVIQDLSDLARSMSCETIANNGLVKGLEFEVLQLSKSGIYEIQFEVAGNCVFLDYSKEIVLFRIFQECLHNIMKHAEASKIHIRLDYKNTEVLLTVEDNGKGFVVDKFKEGSGIKNITKRTSLLRGLCSISSGVKGTIITITIPITDDIT